MSQGLDPLLGVYRLLDAARHVAPSDAPALLDGLCEILGAQGGRLYVADYSLQRLQRIDNTGPVGLPQTVAGTLAGRAFSSGEVMVSKGLPTVVLAPLVDGTTRIGLLELDYEVWDDTLSALMEPVLAAFVLVLVNRRRYSDHWDRARRTKPLSAAAEIQWDLLPPLSCSTDDFGIGGILEPAYDIGGDSFDYAINGQHLEFAIVDAVGHGMSAVLMAAAAINSLRNARRAGLDLPSSYLQTDRLIQEHFGRSNFVTGQIGSLDSQTGILTWINAGHVLPMLVRNGTYAGELACAPSMPFGMGGPVLEVPMEPLQRGDRVLFYTDGITESLSPDGGRFGVDRLADLLVRASLERVPVRETARRLSENVLEHTAGNLKDDGTLLLVEFRAKE